MKSTAQLLATVLTLTVLVVAGVAAQVISQPTPPPLVTADSERWFLDGEPITYAGNLYYPAGAQVAFNPNEMIRSGSYLGVPLYARTTDEPFSIVYVPMARGFVQPYARRRTGDVVGTAGTAPLTGVAAAYSPPGATVPIYQAAGPPTHIAGPPADAYGLPRGVIPAVPRTQAAPSGTAGAAVSPSMPPTQPETTPAPPMRTRIGPPPTGLNAVFVQFRDHRWIGEGRTVPLDRSSMIEVGELGGFPVFADRAAPEQRIYVAIAKEVSLLAAYRR
jgi:hypothetical protein